MRSGRVTHLKRKFSNIFLLPTYLLYQNLLCGTLTCHLSIWQISLKLECIC